MSNFWLAFNAVFPLISFCVLGMYLRKKDFLDESALTKLNKVCFKFLMPANIFYSIVNADLGNLLNGKLILLACVLQVVISMISVGIALVSEKEKPRQSALAHGILHGNIIIFGSLIGTSMYGEGNIGVISVVSAILVPFQNMISVIVLEMFRKQSSLSLKKTAVDVASNPLVLAALIGFALRLAGITLPKAVLSVCRDLGRCGTPMAMISMGGLFNFSSVRSNRKALSIATVSRLILLPLCTLPVTAWLGYRGVEFTAIMCLFMTPAATSSYPMSVVMGGDGELASQIVISTSLFSLITIFCWILLYGILGVL